MFGGSFSLINPFGINFLVRLLFGSRTHIFTGRVTESMPSSNSSRMVKLTFFPTSGLRERAIAEIENCFVEIFQKVFNIKGSIQNQFHIHNLPIPSPPVVIKKCLEYFESSNVLDAPPCLLQ